MTNALNYIPVSSSVVSGTTRPRPSEKHHYAQLLNQFISRAVSWPTERQPTPNLGTTVEDDWKMEKRQEELETLKLFGAGIAHDLGNVLTVIMGNLEIVRLSESQSELWQIFQELEEAVYMAKALNTQLHQLVQGASPVKESVSLVELLQDTTRLGLFGSEVECSFKLPSNLPPVQIDRCQISQVIENLVINAVQAMPNGGQLEVEATSFELAGAQVQGLVAGQYVLITVRDNGIGIPPEQLSLIFAPHFTTKAQGQGLGLALCYTIIKRHKGHISVESQPGIGTTFRLWLPVN